jgi:hypothetical protein
MTCAELNIPKCNWCVLGVYGCWLLYWKNKFAFENIKTIENMFIKRITEYSDPLFSSLKRDFYMLKAAEIYNKDIYNRLCNIAKLKVLL